VTSSVFELTPTLLSLIRHLIVAWLPIESGAPGLMYSPYQAEEPTPSSPAFYADMAARAGLTVESPPSAADRQRIDALRSELPQAFAQFMQRATLRPGRYSYANPLVGELAGWLPPDAGPETRQETVSFDFSADHAELRRHTRWDGLFVNPKRPFGDMTCFELDMADILGETTPRDEKGHPAFTPAQQERFDRLYVEMLPAIQVFLAHAELEPGSYARVAE
jgi:hypothetical protein